MVHKPLRVFGLFIGSTGLRGANLLGHLNASCPEPRAGDGKSDATKIVEGLGLGIRV